MPRSSEQWGDLASNIRGIGSDSLNHSLGLAKFIQADRVNDANIAKTQVETDKLRLDLKRAKLADEEANAPTTLHDVYTAISNMPGLTQAESGVLTEKVMGVLGAKHNPDNTNVYQPITNEDGELIPKYKFKQSLPIVGGIVAAATNPMTVSLTLAQDTKRKMGYTSAGPDLNPVEQKELTTKDRNLVAQYNNAMMTYQDLYKNPDKALTLHKASIAQLKGIFDSQGVPSADLEKYFVDVGNTIEEHQKKVKLDKQLAKESGISEDEFVTEQTRQAIATQNMSNVSAQKVAGIQSASHERVAQANAAKERLGAERISFNNNLANIGKNSADNYVKSLTKSPTGEFTRIKKDKNGKVEKDDDDNPIIEVVPQEEILQGQEQAATKAVINAQQEAYDSKQYDRLQIPPPTYIDKSDLKTRAYFRSQVDSLDKELAKIKNPNFGKTIDNNINVIIQKVKTGDPKQIEEARVLLTHSIVSLQKFNDSQKQNTPKQIKKMAKGLVQNDYSDYLSGGLQ